MKAATLSPLFRSAEQAKLLAELFAGGDERELSDLYRSANVHQSTASREIRHLEQGGIVISRMVGRSKLVRIDPDMPYVDELRRIIDATFGALAVARDIYSGLDAIDEAFIFGSWARRHHGTPGPAPRDLDIAVVSSDPGRGRFDRDLLEAASTLQERTGLEIDQKLFSPDSDFLASIRPDSIKVC